MRGREESLDSKSSSIYSLPYQSLAARENKQDVIHEYKQNQEDKHALGVKALVKKQAKIQHQLNEKQAMVLYLHAI